MGESKTENGAPASLEEVQGGWNELSFRVRQLEAEKCGLEQESKSLRFLIERVIEHRQKSHSELVLLLTTLVSKLPLNDVGVIVSKLVEHNTNVNQMLAALGKGVTDTASLPQPVILKNLEQSKRDLAAAIKPSVEELLRLDPPFEKSCFQSLVEKPELFFSPPVVRANRCFIKGQVARERIVREFGEPALIFFNDMSTDPKLNPNPKTEEIVLSFKNDFEALFQQNPSVGGEKRQELMALYQRVQQSKSQSEAARAQRNAFNRLSFFVELLHFYENQGTEAPDVLFAQRLPALVEQLVLSGGQDKLDQKLIEQAEGLIAMVVIPDHRLMIINNVGKTGGIAKTLKYVLRLRMESVPDFDQVSAEFIKHLLPADQKLPATETIAGLLQMLKPDRQKMIVKSIMFYDRIRRTDAEALARAVGGVLGLKGLDEEIKAAKAVPPDVERQMVWSKIKDMINQRNDPATIANAIRDRLHAKYDSDEMKQSWVTLTEADPISLIRVFCQLPYRGDGKTDPIAQTVMETYVTRLMHEKYAGVYSKIVSSLRNMFKAKADSPTLMNFIALVRWVNADAANKLQADIGMAVPA